MKPEMNNPILHRMGASARRALAVRAGLALVIAATLFDVGCQSARTIPQDAMIPSRPVTLTAGDVVKLTFLGAPELNLTQKIRADGKLSLPQIGEVSAAGKMLPQFQAELVRLYKSQLRNSEVLVTLEYSGIQVYMAGAINKPGKLQFDRPTTILQAIAEAGGVSAFGTLKKVKIVRLENGQQRVQTLDLRSAKKSATDAFYVRDGDIITIPETLF